VRLGSATGEDAATRINHGERHATPMWILGIVFLLLSSLVALCNICDCVAGELRRRMGAGAGYANLPMLSLFFSTLAWLLARQKIGAWAFLPALLDPGNLMPVFASIVLLFVFMAPRK
jgi:hypothetical protein